MNSSHRRNGWQVCPGIGGSFRRKSHNRQCIKEERVVGSIDRLPFAISFAIAMNPKIMISIQNGPNPAYAAEYADVNNRINRLSTACATEIIARRFHAMPLSASDRTDPKHIRGDFPHKTAVSVQLPARTG